MIIFKVNKANISSTRNFQELICIWILMFTLCSKRDIGFGCAADRSHVR